MLRAPTRSLGPSVSSSVRWQRCEAQGDQGPGWAPRRRPLPAGRAPRARRPARRALHAAGCPACAPSSASWRPWRPVAPSPSRATVFTSTGSGVATPRSRAACGTVSRPRLGRAERAGPPGELRPRVPPSRRGPRGARRRRSGSQPARATSCLQKSPGAKGRDGAPM